MGVREGVEEDTNKKNKNDFVLWFTKSKFEDQALKWDSPWGVGYPGWHIECSGISMKYNGEYLDLHCGGVDNAFPHHTERDRPVRKLPRTSRVPHWCHVAHLNTTDGKMSKSKGEFLTVSLRLSRRATTRWPTASSACRATTARALCSPGRIWTMPCSPTTSSLRRSPTSRTRGGVDEAVRAEYRAKFSKEMDNDLNTAMGVTVLYDVLKAKTSGATKLAIMPTSTRS